MSNYVTIQGQTDDNQKLPLHVTPEGHLEVAVHGPTLPFGSLHVEEMEPIFQVDAVYTANPYLVATATGLTSGSGANSATATTANNYFACTTGTTANSFASVESRKRLRYRPGQGIIGRFAGRFTAPAANAKQYIGFGSAEAGIFFGYDGTSFGLCHRTGGVREIQTLTVTTASTATNNYVVTLPSGTAVSVTATNNGSTTRTAYEIAQGTFPGWKAEARGATVVFVSETAGPVNMISLAQTGAGTPAAGTWAETLAGVAATENWVPQSQWNGEPTNGTGAMDFTLDPAKANVYQIGVQYLGTGPIVCQIEVPSISGNNATWVTVHTFNFPNSGSTVSLTQPALPFYMGALSFGSTTSVGVYVSSFAGFIEGRKRMHGPRMTYSDTSTAVSTSSYYSLMTVRNSIAYSGRANQSVVNLLSFCAACEDTTPVIFYLIKNAALVGTPNFVSHSSSSCTYTDTAATTCTITNNDQIIYTLMVGPNGEGLIVFEDEITLQPGEQLTIAATAVTGTATFSVASINTREDQ